MSSRKTVMCESRRRAPYRFAATGFSPPLPEPDVRLSFRIPLQKTWRREAFPSRRDGTGRPGLVRAKTARLIRPARPGACAEADWAYERPIARALGLSGVCTATNAISGLRCTPGFLLAATLRCRSRHRRLIAESQRVFLAAEIDLGQRLASIIVRARLSRVVRFGLTQFKQVSGHSRH